MQKTEIPNQGEKITISSDGKLNVPFNPIIPFIEGDGIGPDIWAASVRVFDRAIEKAYNNNKGKVKVKMNLTCEELNQEHIIEDEIGAN